MNDNDDISFTEIFHTLKSYKKSFVKWFISHSQQTKILLTVGLITHLVHSVYLNFGYIPSLNYYGIPVVLIRITGFFIGQLFPTLIISAIISIFPYLIFKDIAEKYKRYLDYFSVVFVILSLILIYISIKKP